MHVILVLAKWPARGSRASKVARDQPTYEGGVHVMHVVALADNDDSGKPFMCQVPCILFVCAHALCVYTFFRCCEIQCMADASWSKVWNRDDNGSGKLWVE